MLNIFLTQYDGSIVGPIAKLLGKIMEWLYQLTDMIGIANVGLCIILFTIVVKLLLMPLTIKQQKFSKLSTLMNPELQAIQKKYKDKRDQDSMMKMQEETKAVYDKYGTSPSGSCLQLLIQMPILFALYRVIMNIPAYVPQIKSVYMNIVDAIGEDKLIKHIGGDIENANQIVDKLATYSTDNWNALKEAFSGQTAVIESNVEVINDINSFFGMNLSQAPMAALGISLIIPVLAVLTQWFSFRMTQRQQEQSMEDNPMMASMKMMNYTMPIMSGIMCLSFASGIGLYWVISSLMQIIQQTLINLYFKKVDVNDIVKKNIEKQNKKRAKMGLPPQKVTNVAHMNVKNIDIETEKAKQREAKRQEQIKKDTEYYNKNAKPGSLAAKANMVSLYNEKNKK